MLLGEARLGSAPRRDREERRPAAIPHLVRRGAAPASLPTPRSACVAGGITGAMMIAAIAESVGSKVVPHSPRSPVSTATCLQVTSAVANHGIMELPDHSESPATERYTASTGGERRKFDQSSVVRPIPNAVDGYVLVPTAPGLGIELDFELAVQIPSTRVKTLSRLGGDGAVDQ